MSIFSVLRYPVSDIPTTIELHRIPVRIYNQWVSDMRNRLYQSDTHPLGFEIDLQLVLFSPEHMPGRLQRALSSTRLQEVKNLRKLIKEYEE